MKTLTIAILAVALIGFDCAGVLCMRHFNSEIEGRQNFDFVDTETGETLLVRWLTPDMTLNLHAGATGAIDCWTYDGERISLNCQ